jgi:hypothetical protein
MSDETELALAREALRAVEWAGADVNQWVAGNCPLCDAAKPGPHAPRCLIGRALAGRER